MSEGKMTERLDHLCCKRPHGWAGAYPQCYRSKLGCTHRCASAAVRVSALWFWE
jgi:hypothetical protein